MKPVNSTPPTVPGANEVKPEAKSKSNIFSTPLSKTKLDKKAGMKKKNLVKAYMRLGIAVVFLGIYSFIFLYEQVPAYLNFNQNYQSVQEDIERKEVTLANLSEERDTHKAAYDITFKEDQEVINTVFPEEVNKLGVIRLMENFSTHLNTVYPPFEFTSISFREPVKEKGFTVLPFQTSIKASPTNFDRFLGLINLSGSIDSGSTDHIRLMEISNISLNYIDTKEGGQEVNFNVQLKAYSR